MWILRLMLLHTLPGSLEPLRSNPRNYEASPIWEGAQLHRAYNSYLFFVSQSYHLALPTYGHGSLTANLWSLQLAYSTRPGAHFPLVFYCRLNWEVAGPAGTASRLPSSDFTFLLSHPGSLRRDLPSLL